MINIAVDGVALKDLEQITAELEAIFAGYPDKRITVTLQDQPLVKFG